MARSRVRIPAISALSRPRLAPVFHICSCPKKNPIMQGVSMRGLWIAVAMTVALPSEALAEYMPPSDVDLKAAYCVGRLQEVSTVVTEALPEASRAGAVEVNARIDAARIRLRAYILPRLKFVDGSGMIAATNIGASDQRAYAVAIQGCLAALPNTATTADKEAFSACYIKAGWPKLRECQYVEFLPF